MVAVQWKKYCFLCTVELDYVGL